jgi:hypothetical protein
MRQRRIDQFHWLDLAGPDQFGQPNLSKDA